MSSTELIDKQEQQEEQPLGIAITSMLTSASDNDIRPIYKTLHRISPEVLTTMYTGFYKCECTTDDGSLPEQPDALRNIPAETWFELVCTAKQEHATVLAEPLVKALFVTILFSVLMIGSSLCMISILPLIAFPLFAMGCFLPLCIFEPVNLLYRAPGVLDVLDTTIQSKVVDEWNPLLQPYGWRLVYTQHTVASWSPLCGCYDERMRLLEFVPCEKATTAGISAQTV